MQEVKMQAVVLRNDGNVADVDLGVVTLAGAALELTDGVDERGALDITDGTTKLNNANIGLAA